MPDDIADAVGDAFHEEWGQVVATLIRITGDWDLAEECAQDAFATALQQWPDTGVPNKPGAWLTTVARHRAIDILRRRAVGAAKIQEVASMPPAGEPDPNAEGFADDQLRLIFTCCHPALNVEAQVALTLRTLAGLTVDEVGRAFGLSESAMTKRLWRAKHKIRHAGIPFSVPAAHHLPERTPAVLAIVYLLFNEGYAATSGENLLRRQLSTEAIRLGRTLTALMPDEPEAAGLLALMLLHDSRRDARLDETGNLVTLEEQDRARWDRGQIYEGVTLLTGALRRRAPGRYQVQAAIAACHAEAPTAAATDWPQILRLYDQLLLVTPSPSPVLELNRAVAVAMVDGPAAGLKIVDELTRLDALSGYYLLAATRADLQRRLRRFSDAAEAYRQALELASTASERAYLSRRLAEVHNHTAD